MAQKPTVRKTAAHHPAELPLTGFIRSKDLVPNFIPISRTSLWNMVKRGDFPAPVKLGPATTAWRVEEVRAWIDARPTA